MDRLPVGRLAALLRPHRTRVAVAGLLALGVAALAGLSLGLLKPALEVLFDPAAMETTLATVRRTVPPLTPLVDALARSAAADPVAALAWLLAVLVGLTLVRGALRWGHEVIVGTTAHEATTNLLDRLFAALLRQDLGHLRREGAASFVSRFTADADAVAKALETLAGSLILEPLLFLAYATTAFVLSWKLALLAIVATPLLAFLVRRVSTAVRRSVRRVLEKREGLVVRVEESLRGARVVQAYGGEAVESARFRATNERVFAEFRRLVRLEAASGPALEVIALLGVCGALLAGGHLAAAGEIRPGDLFVVAGALAGMYSPLRKIGGALNRVQGGLAGAGRLLAVLERAPAVRDAAGARPLPDGPGAVAFRGVVVEYAGGVRALDGLDLEVAPGERIAVVGPSGAGKSTLLDLVPRFLDPTAGAVHIDGADLREVDLRSLRSALALVPQEVFLHEGTIRENVLYGRPGASADEVRAACDAAHVTEIIERLPGGLDAPVGPAGALLSGGERQRVAVARAMLRNPRVLLLDEPTSSLDARGEALVHEALERLCRGRTTLVVAHRVATVADADRILVLDGGRPVALGTHTDLLATNDLYRSLASGPPVPTPLPAGQETP